jgi:hypothetical protein
MYKHTPGNNRNSLKFKRLQIPLVRDSDITSTITGRYYLPEQPDLEKYTIVSIQANFGGNDLPILDNNSFLGAQVFNIGLWTGFSQSSFLTLYNQNMEEIIYNFPIIQLFNSRAGRDPVKIIPFNTKVNIKKSYIFLPAAAAPPPNLVLSFNLTFFYK